MEETKKESGEQHPASIYDLSPEAEEIMAEIRYDGRGLVPAIVQDEETKQVLMLAYMNEESLRRTLCTGTTWFYSRSRQALWNKGETSGHFQYVSRVSYDCDGDTILVIARQVGAACIREILPAFTGIFRYLRLCRTGTEIRTGRTAEDLGTGGRCGK